jgi:16S rRNA (guanine966-N2)-methyltransferase
VSRAPGEVRIIGGRWKRSKLAVPHSPGLRPTPDRVRETLFNWLGQDLSGWRCIDAFAGSGALGFEAASRGATEVLLVEQDPALAEALRKNAERLQASPDSNASPVGVRRGDGVAAMASLVSGASNRGWDLVFLDPPFGLKPAGAEVAGAKADAKADTRADAKAQSPGNDPLVARALAAALPLLAPDGLVYLEAPRAWTNACLQPLGLQVQRSAKAGAVHYHLLARLHSPPGG